MPLTQAIARPAAGRPARKRPKRYLALSVSGELYEAIERASRAQFRNVYQQSILTLTREFAPELLDPPLGAPMGIGSAHPDEARLGPAENGEEGTHGHR